MAADILVAAGALVLEVAVHRQGETGHRRTLLGMPQLRVFPQATHDDDSIQHRQSPRRVQPRGAPSYPASDYGGFQEMGEDDDGDLPF